MAPQLWDTAGARLRQCAASGLCGYGAVGPRCATPSHTPICVQVCSRVPTWRVAELLEFPSQPPVPATVGSAQTVGSRVWGWGCGLWPERGWRQVGLGLLPALCLCVGPCEQSPVKPLALPRKNPAQASQLPIGCCLEFRGGGTDGQAQPFPYPTLSSLAPLRVLMVTSLVAVLLWEAGAASAPKVGVSPSHLATNSSCHLLPPQQEMWTKVPSSVFKPQAGLGEWRGCAHDS